MLALCAHTLPSAAQLSLNHFPKLVYFLPVSRQAPAVEIAH